jgi:NDP-sugar pyrophosphorylase family protein
VRAVVLAGGAGTRFLPYTTVLPKPLIPVGDRPILELILHRLAACGVTRVDLCIGHLGELIQTYFSQAQGLPEELQLEWHREDEPRGTAGALRGIPDLNGSFIVMNGDVLTDLDVREVLEFHELQGAALTVAVHEAAVEVEFGVVEHTDGVVVAYDEKPVLRYDVSIGVYVYSPRALAHLGDGPLQFPELVARLLAADERVAAYRCAADVYHVGSPAEHEDALQRLVEGRGRA